MDAIQRPIYFRIRLHFSIFLGLCFHALIDLNFTIRVFISRSTQHARVALKVRMMGAYLMNTSSKHTKPLRIQNIFAKKMWENHGKPLILTYFTEKRG